MQNPVYPNIMASAPSHSVILQPPPQQPNQRPMPPPIHSPMFQQPLNSSYATSPNIIINNSTNAPLTYADNAYTREWSSELCNCFGDVGECCFAFFCPLCYQVKIFIDADETCCSCLFGGLVPLRTKIRTKNKIKGSICSDYCVLFWCGFCATVQMGIELKNTRKTY